MPRKKGIPYARSDSLKERRNFSLTLKAFKGLGRLFEFFNLGSTSALLESIGRGELFVSKRPRSFKELMAVWDLDELAVMAGIPVERLEEIRTGKGDRAQPHELIGLESATGVAYEKLDQLANKGEHQSNGC
jgi:hypothetical protein